MISEAANWQLGDKQSDLKWFRFVYKPNEKYELDVTLNFLTYKVELRYDTLGVISYETDITFDAHKMESFISNILEQATQNIEKHNSRKERLEELLDNFNVSETNERIISWNEYISKCSKLSSKIGEAIQYNKTPTYLFAIGRGGFPAATIISHCLGKQLGSIITSSYVEKEQKEIYVSNLSLPQELEGKYSTLCTIILIDDINDSGKTFTAVFNKVKEQFPNAIIETASLFVREGSQSNYSIEVVPEGQWLIFPYER